MVYGPAGLDFYNLKWGEINNLKENDSNNSGDRRRTSTTTAIRLATEKAFTKDTLESRNAFNGFVINSRKITVPLAEDPKKLVQLKSERAYRISDSDPAASPSYLYKVYIPELSALPPPRGPKDPVIQSYPDITLYSGATIRQKPLPYGTQVVVTYADVKNLTGGAIEAIAHEGSPMTQTDGCTQPAARRFANGTSTTVAASTNTVSDKDRRMADHAKELKRIRREIFESTGAEWKTARGGMDGPFARKKSDGKSVSWENNAILDGDAQVALKAKYQWKINEVLSATGIPEANLDAIFKAESGTFDPYAINHTSAATGLIQFMPEFARRSWLKKNGFTVEEVLTMGPEKQLDLVKNYLLDSSGGRSGTVGGKSRKDFDAFDWYLVVFYPKAIGKPDTYIIGSVGSSTARKNPGYQECNWDSTDPRSSNPAGAVTVRRVRARHLYKTTRGKEGEERGCAGL